MQIPNDKSETARKYRFADGAPGEIGLIAPVTQAFCGHCSRIRLTADGKLRTCLFSKEDRDLRALLRANSSDEEVVDVDPRRRERKGRRPPHQRAGLRAALAHHGVYRRVVH